MNINELGKYLILIGHLLINIKPEELNGENSIKEENKEEYLSRKEVIELYHPVLTEYGLNQSIHMKGLPHIKRGNKYFFKKSEIDKWLEDNRENKGKTRVRYV